MVKFKTLFKVIQQGRANALNAAVSSLLSAPAPNCLPQHINDAFIGVKVNLHHLPILLLGTFNL